MELVFFIFEVNICKMMEFNFLVKPNGINLLRIFFFIVKLNTSYFYLSKWRKIFEFIDLILLYKNPNKIYI